MADIIRPAVNFLPCPGPRPNFSICFLVYLSLLQECRFQDIGFGIRILPSVAENENVFEGVKMMLRVLRVAQCCIIV